MLQQRGIACTLLEAAEEIRPLGVGINALPHCIRELAALDLLPRLDAIAIRTRQLTYANHLGQTIWSEPRGTFGGHDVPQFSIHRGRLQAMLWQAAAERLPPGSLRCGHRLLGFTQDDQGVTARFATCAGEVTLQGAALIGADGIHSTLRALLHPADGGIRWNGIQMWRGAVDWPAFDGGDAMVIAGDAVAKLVLYPIAPGLTPDSRLTNWVIYAKTGEDGSAPPRREDWSRRGRLDDFRHLVDRLSLPFNDTARMIGATEEIFEYPMVDRDPLPWWTQGRVSLLGDAAHAMYPVGSNGASQAVLDARCLADLLVDLAALEALAAYDAARRPATTAIVQSNRGGGPERVIGLVAQRAPDGFAAIGDVATPEEIAAICGGYAQLAGFARPAGG
ncbi:salicylate 1-monooxygenase [Pseudoroseomonas deserti]|uniref:Salicylate 1-monooxygenase n=2 Tax=Teichococcus deserti TaxID=1817963 RepID=A0A1V2H3P0_9PROT|nr:salicylate 1-monooxygenase [Pseudoroseomonas deserti]